MKTFHLKDLQPILVFFYVSCLLHVRKTQVPPDKAPGKSSLNIYLTDDPSLVFDHVFLDITKVEIKVEDDSESHQDSEHQGDVDDHDRNGDNDGGWMNVDIHPGVYDILRFRNGLDTLFGNISFDATKGLKKVRITLGTATALCSMVQTSHCS